jgi:hypothetical protein
MGRRSRQRARAGNAGSPAGITEAALTASVTAYADPEAGELVLRGALSPASRRAYAETLAGGLNQEDARQRATELLFERLAVSWTIAGVTTSRQKELLARYRVATPLERQFVRESLRRHAEENFPDLDAP